MSRFRKLLLRSGLESELLRMAPGLRELFLTEVHCVLKRRCKPEFGTTAARAAVWCKVGERWRRLHRLSAMRN